MPVFIPDLSSNPGCSYVLPEGKLPSQINLMQPAHKWWVSVVLLFTSHRIRNGNFYFFQLHSGTRRQKGLRLIKEQLVPFSSFVCATETFFTTRDERKLLVELYRLHSL